MLALFGNLNLMELMLIVGAALLVFGGRLPEVVIRGTRHVGRMRRALEKIWREAGIEQEMRDLRREIDVTARTVSEARETVHSSLDPYSAAEPDEEASADPGDVSDETPADVAVEPGRGAGVSAEVEGVDPGALGPPPVEEADATPKD